MHHALRSGVDIPCDAEGEMTWAEFEKAHNFRAAEKCCANCKYGEVGWEGECGCFHPLVDTDERMWSGNMVNDVCDLWERKGGAE